MTSVMLVLGMIAQGLRTALFVIAAVTLVLTLAAWAVRTRRISPFSALARFIRKVTDPLLAPVERRLVRHGQRPADAPWWLLGVVVVGGLLLIAAFDFVANQVTAVWIAGSSGPGGILRLLVYWTFALLRLALLVRVIAGWIAISPMNPVIRLSWRLTEWMLAPLRQIIPMLGMFDITPIVAWFLLGLLQRVVMSLL